MLIDTVRSEAIPSGGCGWRGGFRLWAFFGAPEAQPPERRRLVGAVGEGRTDGWVLRFFGDSVVFWEEVTGFQWRFSLSGCLASLELLSWPFPGRHRLTKVASLPPPAWLLTSSHVRGLRAALRSMRRSCSSL